VSDVETREPFALCFAQEVRQTVDPETVLVEIDELVFAADALRGRLGLVQDRDWIAGCLPPMSPRRQGVSAAPSAGPKY